MGIIFIGVLLFIVAVGLLFIIINDILRKNFLKNLALKYELDLTDGNELRGVYKDQNIHGYFKKDKNSIKNNFYFEISPVSKKKYKIYAGKLNRDFYFNDENIEDDFLTGDIHFDESVLLEVTEGREALAKLNYNIRRMISYFVNMNDGLNIYNDKIVFKNNVYDIPLWTEAVDAMIKISSHLSSDERIEDLLIKNINSSEELADVKINNLEYLIESPNIDQYKNVLKSLLKHPVIEIQIIAAYGLREKGIPELIKILKKAGSDPELRLFSLKYANEFYNDDSIRKMIYSFLESYNEDLVISVLDLLMKKEDEKSINYIVDYINNKKKFINYSARLKFKLLEYTSNFCVKQNYYWLISLLKDKDPETDFFVIPILKEFGEINAVEHLMPLTKGFYSMEIKTAAQEAIDFLQKNVSSSDRGNLAVIETGLGGEVSIDDGDERGELSLEDNG